MPHKQRVPKESNPRITADAVQESNYRFDLTGDYWLEHPEEFWREFKHTGEILVPKDFEKWLIGQERMKEEFFLNLEEWVRKMRDIQNLRDKGEADDKDFMRRFLKERPGPYLLYIGEPGTGKSLLIKIANNKLKELYKKYGIKLQDVMLIKNPVNEKKPLVRYVPAGLGKRIKETSEYVAKAESLKTSIIKSFLSFVMLIGALMIITAMFLIVYLQIYYDPDVAWFQGSGVWLQWLLYGVMLMFFAFFIRWIFSGGMMGGMMGAKTSSLDKVPALMVDNSGDPDLAIDATQNNAAAMFGSIQHDPWQSGGLGTPTHHRMIAGKIHEADSKILFMDEVKNFLMNEQIVIETLTVLEDGAYPIRGRSWHGSEGNASLAGETQRPIDATFFLIAAGNYDSLPVLNNYPALRDRFYYGNIVMADDELPSTPQNEIKLAQFIADECFRFRTPHICREGVRLAIDYARRRASANDKLKLQMRGYIQKIKKGGQLVWAKKSAGICNCGVTDIELIHAPLMRLAIDEYAKPIEQQLLDAEINKGKPYKLITMKGAEIGRVNGLVVMGGMTGNVSAVSCWLRKVSDHEKADYVITGAPVTDKDTWMQNSVRTVRTTIYRLYGIDLAKDYYVHVSFDQTDAKSIDGPSAGVTMTLAIMSWLGDPRIAERIPIPIRQDTCVTGTVENLGINGNDVRVGPVGGIFEKTYGAVKWGAKRIVIPSENLVHNYFDNLIYKDIEVHGAKSVLEYFDLIRGDR